MEMGFCSGRREIGLNLNIAGQVGIYNPGTEWGTVDGRLPRGNISGEGCLWQIQNDSILAADRPG
jgi:hypothetical protein